MIVTKNSNNANSARNANSANNANSARNANSANNARNNARNDLVVNSARNDLVVNNRLIVSDNDVVANLAIEMYRMVDGIYVEEVVEWMENGLEKVKLGMEELVKEMEIMKDGELQIYAERNDMGKEILVEMKNALDRIEKEDLEEGAELAVYAVKSLLPLLKGVVEDGRGTGSGVTIKEISEEECLRIRAKEKRTDLVNAIRKCGKRILKRYTLGIVVLGVCTWPLWCLAIVPTGFTLGFVAAMEKWTPEYAIVVYDVGNNAIQMVQFNLFLFHMTLKQSLSMVRSSVWHLKMKVDQEGIYAAAGQVTSSFGGVCSAMWAMVKS